MQHPFATPEIQNLPPARRLWRAPILAKKEVAPRHFQMRLETPGMDALAHPGQFVHVKSQVLSSAQEMAPLGNPLLRRAFSIMSLNDGTTDILFRVEGQGTQALSQAHKGEFLDLIGPLGRGFDLAMFHVKPATNRHAILVGGGVGVPPMVFLAARLKALGTTVTAILGARTSIDILCEREFAALEVATQICTDDGSRGWHGRVTDLLQPLLQTPNALVLACGPLPMLRAVAQLSRAHGQPCQVSLEENMPCGVGVCNGCVVRVRASSTASNDDYGLYRRICVEGPVCGGEEIDWEASA